MKKSKTSQPRRMQISRDIPETKAVFLEEYCDIYSWEIKIVTERSLEILCKKLVNWARDTESAIKISEFFLKQEGISINTWHTWIHRYPQLQEAEEIAKTLIGIHREKRGLSRMYETAHNMAVMPVYDKNYKEMYEWRSKLKAERDELKLKANIVVLSEIEYNQSLKEEDDKRSDSEPQSGSEELL